VAEIHTLILSQSGGSEGYGFALPVDLAAAALDQAATLGEDSAVDDIFYSMNRQRITGTARLRGQLNGVQSVEPVAFQVGRNGKLRLLVMELP
jgi:hypothetical protein